MRRSLRTAACLMMAAVVVSALLLTPGREASAAVVEIVASSKADANATANATAEQGSIVDRALRQAVLQAAHDILPAPIDDARRVMLDRMLVERARGFVISYAEQEAREDNGTAIRVFDVQVNRRSLKQWLRQLGLFATAHFDLGYSRSIQGASPEQLQSIDQLAMLMGLEQRPGVMPSVTIGREGDAWKGTLQADSGTLSRSSESLPAVWLALWGEYFAGRYEQDPLLAAAAENGLPEEAMTNARGTLVVRGWTDLDAIDAFDVRLKSWPAEAQDVAFGDMHFGANSISASWSLTAKQPNGLKQRIDEYIAGRNLSYTLSLEAPTLPEGEGANATVAETEPGEPIVIEGVSEEVGDQLDEALKNAEQEASRQTMENETQGLDALVDSLADSITSKAGNGTESGANSAPSPGGGMPVQGHGDSTGPKWRDQPSTGDAEPLH